MIVTLPYCNRETRRKVERYMQKHPKLTFCQAYNKLFGTDYVDHIESPIDTTSTISTNLNIDNTEDTITTEGNRRYYF